MENMWEWVGLGWMGNGWPDQGYEQKECFRGLGWYWPWGGGKTWVPSVFSSFLPSWGLISPPLFFLNFDPGMWLFSYFNLDLLKYLPDHGES